MWEAFPPQFFRNYRSGRSHRADKADHCPLQNDSKSVLGQHHYDDGQGEENSGLESQQPPMPLAESQFARIHAAERKEQHGEDQQRLNKADHFGCNFMRGIQPGNTGVEEITAHSAQNGENEDPVFDKFEHSHRLHFFSMQGWCKDSDFCKLLSAEIKTLFVGIHANIVTSETRIHALQIIEGDLDVVRPRRSSIFASIARNETSRNEALNSPSPLVFHTKRPPTA